MAHTSSSSLTTTSKPSSTHPSRRDFLYVATACAGAVGIAASLVPFISQLEPDQATLAAGGPVDLDLAKVQPGQQVVVTWRGRPIFVINRPANAMATLQDPKLLAQLADPQSKRNPAEFTPKYAQNENRSIKPEVLVVVGICTHLGCSPTDKFQPGPQPSLPDNWEGGFLCPCHGSTFDLAGRVFKNKPAPDNLPVPPHKYLSDTRLLIGEDGNA